MNRAFTWFPHFGSQIEALPSEMQDEYILAIARFGMYGEEPEFSNPILSACFEGIRTDIENSVKNRTENKGGRPPKKTKDKTTVKNQGYKPTQETQEQNDGEKPTEKPNLIQAKLGLANLNQGSKGVVGGSAKRFTPPTLTDVFAYGSEYVLKHFPMHDPETAFDAEKFYDYFQAQGWKLSNGNAMKDWRAAVRQWINRDLKPPRPKGVTVNEPDPFDEYRD